MTRRRLLAAAAATLAAGTATAGDRRLPPAYCPPAYPAPQGPGVWPSPPGVAPLAAPTPGDPPAGGNSLTPPPAGNPFPAVNAAAPAVGAFAAAESSLGGDPYGSNAFNTTVIGNFGTAFVNKYETVGTTTVDRVVGFVPRVAGFNEVVSLDAAGNKVVTRVPVVVNDPVTVRETTPGGRRLVRIPAAARYAGVSVSENDSPRPADRVYVNFHHFDKLGAALNPGLGEVTGRRQAVGFERTFLDGDASFGARLPFVQTSGPGSIGGKDIGDLTLIAKYAFDYDRAGDNVTSAGVLLTLPTGSGGGFFGDANGVTATRVTHSLLFQPWLGFVRTSGNWFSQGFTSAVVPTDGRDPLLLLNSLQVGVWAYRAGEDRIVRGVAPIAEVHVTTPLTNRAKDSLVYVPDQVNFTAGFDVLLKRATAGAALSIPLAGPRPWNVEVLVRVNLRF